MSVTSEVLHQLDPRKSYDRGVWSGPRDGLATEPVIEASLSRTPMNLTALSSKDLRLELERRVNSLHQMKAHRATLARQLASLDAEIAGIEGAIGGNGRKPARVAEPKPKNSLTLADAIAMAVEVRATVTPAEAAQLVLANGYRTTSKTFSVAVATTLAKHAGFTRVGRGRYERVA